MSTPAPLLSPQVIEQAKRLGAAIRQKHVAALVGSGISLQAGVPTWSALVSKLILAWNEWDTTAAQDLPPDDYVRLFRSTFGSNLAIVSYLQRRAADGEGPEFGKLLYTALYTLAGTQQIPEPTNIHRHLIALFDDHPKRIWTTNYDDLLEEAAALNGIPASSLDPIHRLTDGNFLVSHLHGFMPPERRSQRSSPAAETAVILAEDDFHALTMDVIGWTNREFYRLFDDHRVFIVGMSLDDPNLRRVLATIPASTSDPPRHFALLRNLPPERLSLSSSAQARRGDYTDGANEMRSWYWKVHGVEIIAITAYEDILPFLMRVRYESYGRYAGDLWLRGSELGYQAIEPWSDNRQQTGRSFLGGMAQRLIADFSLEPDELVEVGIFLLRSGTNRLELTFRSGPWECRPGLREFDVDPDHPTGLAGRVFISGDMVRVRRSDPLHDYGLDVPSQTMPERYEGIISVPLIDWEHGGIPVGVAYVTVSTTDGTLFRLSSGLNPPGQKTLNDVYTWLSEIWPQLRDALKGAIL